MDSAREDSDCQSEPPREKGLGDGRRDRLLNRVVAKSRIENTKTAFRQASRWFNAVDRISLLLPVPLSFVLLSCLRT